MWGLDVLSDIGTSRLELYRLRWERSKYISQLVQILTALTLGICSLWTSSMVTLTDSVCLKLENLA